MTGRNAHTYIPTSLSLRASPPPPTHFLAPLPPLAPHLKTPLSNPHTPNLTPPPPSPPNPPPALLPIPTPTPNRHRTRRPRRKMKHKTPTAPGPRSGVRKLPITRGIGGSVYGGEEAGGVGMAGWRLPVREGKGGKDRGEGRGRGRRGRWVEGVEYQLQSSGLLARDRGLRSFRPRP